MRQLFETARRMDRDNHGETDKQARVRSFCPVYSRTEAVHKRRAVAG